MQQNKIYQKIHEKVFVIFSLQYIPILNFDRLSIHNFLCFATYGCCHPCFDLWRGDNFYNLFESGWIHQVPFSSQVLTAVWVGTKLRSGIRGHAVVPTSPTTYISSRWSSYTQNLFCKKITKHIVKLTTFLSSPQISFLHYFACWLYLIPANSYKNRRL